MTALRLDGRMFKAGSDGGEPDAGAGGGGICCAEVLLDRARTRGDSGTEFRSGMLLFLTSCALGVRCVEMAKCNLFVGGVVAPEFGWVDGVLCA